MGDGEHRPIARRRADRDVALSHAEPCSAHVPDRHAFLVIVQIEAVEIDALLAFDLDDAHHLAGMQRDRLPRDRTGARCRNGTCPDVCMSGNRSNAVLIERWLYQRKPCFFRFSRYQWKNIVRTTSSSVSP